MLEVIAIKYNDIAPVLPIAQCMPAEGGTIGRDSDNTMVLPDPMRVMSRRHLQVTRTAEGGYRLDNISESNPALLNDTNLQPGEGRALSNGDQIRIGCYLLAVRITAEAAAQPEANAIPTATPTAVAPPASEAERGVPFEHSASPAVGAFSGLGALCEPDGYGGQVLPGGLPDGALASDDDVFRDLLGEPVSMDMPAAMAPHSAQDIDAILDLGGSRASLAAQPFGDAADMGIDLADLAGDTGGLLRGFGSDEGGGEAHLLSELMQDPLARQDNALMEPASVDPLKIFGDEARPVLGLFGERPPEAAAPHGSHGLNHRIELNTPFMPPTLGGAMAPTALAGGTVSATGADSADPTDLAGLQGFTSAPGGAEFSFPPAAEMAADAATTLGSPALNPHDHGHSHDSDSVFGLIGTGPLDGLLGGEPHGAGAVAADVADAAAAPPRTAAPLGSGLIPDDFGLEELLAPSQPVVTTPSVTAVPPPMDGMAARSRPLTAPHGASEVFFAVDAEGAAVDGVPEPAPELVPGPLLPPAANPAAMPAGSRTSPQAVPTTPAGPAAVCATAPVPPGVAPRAAAPVAEASREAKGSSPAETIVVPDAAADVAGVNSRTAGGAKVAGVEGAASEAAQAERDALYAALLEGLGIEALPERHAVDPALMKVIGALLRISVEGTLHLMAARATVKREVRANVTLIAPERNNPLKFSPDSGVALMYLLGQGYPGFMGPEEAMGEAFSDLYDHQLGVVSGMRSALGHVLERFDPETISRTAHANGMIESLLSVGRKARLWDAYGRYFENAKDQAVDRFQDFFGAAFVDAYEETSRNAAQRKLEER